jgi:glycosyltransferase involved in cell wall biosynthesis
MGINPNIFYVVSNTIGIETFVRGTSSIEKCNRETENKRVILYSGTVSPDRGLLTAAQSAMYFEKLEIDPLIFIIGEGSYRKFLIEFVKKNNLNKYVRFIDWPGHENIPSYLQKASICIVPQPANDFIITTIPHKLFEFMFMEKPILVSDTAPLKRIVEETNAGVVFKSGDERDFAEKLKLMLSSSIDWSINGRNAVLNKYNWGNEAKELLRVYDSFNFAPDVN